jgi:integrase
VFRTFALPRGRHDDVEGSGARISGRDVARTVQRAVAAVGLDGDFAAHSLRSGFVTSAAQKKIIPEDDIMRVTGHRSAAVLRGYVRRATLFEDAPLATIMG